MMQQTRCPPRSGLPLPLLVLPPTRLLLLLLMRPLPQLWRRTC